MKTRYKYIHFDLAGGSGRKPCYHCRNNKSGGFLGVIDYYSRWRSYVFSAASTAVFDESCLLDIIDFMKQLK
jgi:hypothetical protein